MHIITEYLNYILSSKGSRKIHSPFIFSLYRNCIKDKYEYEEYHQVENIYNHLIKNNNYLEITDFGTGREKTRKISEIARTSSTFGKYGKLLFRLTRYFKPSYILELGTSLGIGTLYLHLGNLQAKITTIEGCPNLTEFVKKHHFQQYPKINILCGNIKTLLPQIMQLPEKPNLYFFDADHRFENSLEYYNIVKNNIPTSNEIVLIIDDIRWSTEMKKFWYTVVNDNFFSVTIDLFRMGIAINKKGKAKEHFILRF